jgi:hypothetical protein
MTPLARIRRRRMELRLEMAVARTRFALSPLWRGASLGGLAALALRWWRRR